MKRIISIIVTALLLLIVLRFNAISQGWEELASLQNPTPFPVMASANGKIYLLSGTQGTPAKTFEYDPVSNTWSEKATIPSGTIYASAAEVDGKIYVMGGGQTNVKKSLHYIYDTETNTVTAGDTLLTPRMYHSAASANGRIYLIGGQNGDGTTEWFFDEYTPETNSWSRKTQTPHNQAWYCGAVGIGTKFYRIAGGRWNLPTDYFDVYDTETNQWETLDPFPITLHAPAAVSFQGKIIVMGGYNNENKIDSIYTYYPSSGLWILSFNKLPEPMAYHKAAVIGNYVYIYNKDESGQNGRLWRYKFGTTDVENTQFDAETISINPNPCSGILNINIPSINHEKFCIEISNIIGNKIYENNNLIKGDNLINLNGISSGIYFVRIKYNDKNITKKIIIN